jgi:hypothetical protein
MAAIGGECAAPGRARVCVRILDLQRSFSGLDRENFQSSMLIISNHQQPAIAGLRLANGIRTSDGGAKHLKRFPTATDPSSQWKLSSRPSGKPRPKYPAEMATEALALGVSARRITIRASRSATISVFPSIEDARSKTRP